MATSDPPRRARALPWIRGLIGVAAFLLVAEVLSVTGVVSRSALPPISTVLGQAVLLLGNTQFLGDLAATIEAWAAGLAITLAVGVPAGLVLGSVPGVRSATRAVVEFLRPIPPVALIPLVALVVGPGLRMNLTLVVYAAIWPVLFNTIYGLDDVDPVAIQTLRAFGFGRFDVIRRVFQDYSRSLYPWLSVRDNVALPLRRSRSSRAQRRRDAQQALAAVGLNDTAHRYPWQLSGGMQQRVAIARAIACDPVLLLMDEPFGSVDAQTREDLEDLVLRLRSDRGITILLVTHDIDESVYTGDRVIVMTGGPGRVRADLTVQFPEPRDQITTKELPAFVQLRTEVSRLIRGQQATADR